MTYYDIVTEAIYWFKVALVTAALMAIGLWTAIGLGYFTYKVQEQREIECINSLCEKPCDGRKLKRHEGCVK